MTRLCMLYDFDLKDKHNQCDKISFQYFQLFLLTKPESPTAFPFPVLDASSLDTPSLLLHTEPKTHFQHIKELTLNHV